MNNKKSNFDFLSYNSDFFKTFFVVVDVCSFVCRLHLVVIFSCSFEKKRHHCDNLRIVRFKLKIMRKKSGLRNIKNIKKSHNCEINSRN